MMRKLREQHLIDQMMTIAMILFAVFFLCRCTSNMLTNLDYVREYREAADVQLTKAFLAGDNPYTLKSLDSSRTVPPVLYQYSFLNSAVAALFSFFCDGNVVLAHYLVALLSMILSGALVFKLLYERMSNTVIPVLCGVLTLFCHWRFGYLSTTPNSLGVFLTLLTFSLALGRDSHLRTFLIALLTVLLFYTKLYYISVAASILIYKWMRNRKEALRYLVACIIVGLASVLLISLVWPLYFTYSVYFINGMGLNFVPRLFKVRPATLPTVIGQSMLPEAKLFLAGTFNSGPVLYVLKQFADVCIAFAPVMGMLVVGCLYRIIDAKSESAHGNADLKREKTEKAEESEDVEEAHASTKNLLRLSVIQVLVQGLWLCVLGRSNGTYLTYHLQLWMPYILITSCILFDEAFVNWPKKWNSDRISRMGKTALQILILGAFVFASLFFGYKKLPMHRMSAEEVRNWQQAEAYVVQYENQDQTKNHNQNVYYVPELAYMGMKLGKNVYDNGHTAVASAKGLAKWENDLVGQYLFPYAGDIAKMHLRYQEQLRNQIENHELQLVTTDETGFLMNEELLSANGYYKLDTLPLSVGNVTYQVDFWVVEEE